MSQHIPEETIQQLLSKVDLVDLISDYVHLKKSGKNFIGLCPFHAEKTPSFSVSQEKQFYHCFGCGAGGNAFTFLMDMEGYSFTQAIQHLGEQAGIIVQGVESSPQKEEADTEKEWVFKAHQLASQLFHHMLLKRREGKEALEYLYQRGFTQDTIETFEIGFAPSSWDFLTNFLDKRDFPLALMEKGGLLSQSQEGGRYFDRFRNRVMFPIRNRQGKVIAFQGRVIGEGEPKYLNSPESMIFRKSRQLFNFDRARLDIRKHQQAVLFEGCVDVLTAYQEGITYGTATFGTSLTDEQARMLGRNAGQVILCYDSDQAGTEGIRRAAEALGKENCLVKVARLPHGYDPDDYIRAYGGTSFQQEVLSQAQSLTAFEMDALRKNRNLQDDTERMAYIRDVLQVISTIRNAVERDYYLRQLADEFAISLDALKQELGSIYRIRKRAGAGDKAEQKWHNSRNQSKHLLANLRPAYQNAERMLLAHMLQDRELAQEVEEIIGSAFNVDEHSALAAYIYAFYAQGHPPDIGLFLSEVDDDELRHLATDLSSMTLASEITDRERRDYIFRVLEYPKQQLIKEKEEEKKQAERQGDVLKAAKIAMEVLDMKKDLNQQLNNQPFQTFRKEGE